MATYLTPEMTQVLKDQLEMMANEATLKNAIDAVNEVRQNGLPDDKAGMSDLLNAFYILQCASQRGLELARSLLFDADPKHLQNPDWE